MRYAWGFAPDDGAFFAGTIRGDAGEPSIRRQITLNEKHARTGGNISLDEPVTGQAV